MNLIGLYIFLILTAIGFPHLVMGADKISSKKTVKVGKAKQRPRRKPTLSSKKGQTLMHLNSFLQTFDRGPEYKKATSNTPTATNYYSIHQITETDLFIQFIKYDRYKYYTKKVYFDEYINPANAKVFAAYKDTLDKEYARLFDHFVSVFNVTPVEVENKAGSNDKEIEFLKLWKLDSVFFFESLFDQIKNKNEITQHMEPKTKSTLLHKYKIAAKRKTRAEILNDFAETFGRLPNKKRGPMFDHSKALLLFFDKWQIEPPSEIKIYDIWRHFRKEPDFIRGLTKAAILIFYQHNSQVQVYRSQVEKPNIDESTASIEKTIDADLNLEESNPAEKIKPSNLRPIPTISNPNVKADQDRLLEIGFLNYPLLRTLLERLERIEFSLPIINDGEFLINQLADRLDSNIAAQEKLAAESHSSEPTVAAAALATRIQRIELTLEEATYLQHLIDGHLVCQAAMREEFH